MNQAQHNKLVSLGYSGSLNQMYFKFLGDLGLSGTLNEREIAWLRSIGATATNLNTAWKQVLTLNGYNYPITEGKYFFWLNYTAGPAELGYVVDGYVATGYYTPE